MLTVNPYPPVLGLADGNHANLLWDKDSGRVRLIDWEDSGSNDRAFELGELIEHISRIDGGFDEARLLAHIDLTRRKPTGCWVFAASSHWDGFCSSARQGRRRRTTLPARWSA